MEIKKLDLDPDIPVSIELSTGNINIIRGDRSEVELDYSSFENIKLEMEIRKDDKNYISFKNSELLRTNAIFYLPLKIKNIEAHLVSGNLFAREISGDLNLQSDNGNIMIKGCSGRLKSVAFNGNIKIMEYNGELDVQSTNGDIKLLNISMKGGNIQSSNGKIVLGLNKPADEVNVRSNYGKIVVGLSKGNPCTIIARGTDVLKYMNDSLKGEALGSPAKFDWEGGGIKVNLFSSANKVIITPVENLDEIVPDIEAMLNEFERVMKETFKDIGKKMETFGKAFSQNFKKIFNEVKSSHGNNSDQSDDKDYSSNEKMEILKMLKEGKISAEEAEKLLRALK